MMEHIRQFDWCTSQPDIYFLEEAEMDKCVTERILRNKFRDPLISSESEDERAKAPINWSEVFNRRETDERQHRIFVPGLRQVPPYPKVSSLSSHQHFQCLRVLCAKYPNVLKAESMLRPGKQDQRVFEELKVAYAKEQQEYIDWAKTVWTNTQCVRALRPKPGIEMVYEAEFKMRAREMGSFPKLFELAAQIPLESRNNKCEMVYDKDLLSVKVTELPQIECPDLRKKYSILRPCSIPEPCSKHPCRFVLPNEKSMSILPLTEIHRDLAQYAVDNGAQYIASERALKCLMELDKNWALPLSVCQVISADGEKRNVIVLGSEFSVHRESAQTRTYRAFRHLLECAFIPASEKAKQLNNGRSDSNNSHHDSMESLNSNLDGMDVTSSDDEDNLFIDTDISQTHTESESEEQTLTISKMDVESPKTKETTSNKSKKRTKSETTMKEAANGPEKNEFYSCTCKDSLFESPPPRSFKKWILRNNANNDTYSIVVHCPHKVRGKSGEVILEPIPEYQIDLGGSKQSENKVRSLALSLLLRRSASLINVRIDSLTGDVVTIDNIFMEEYLESHGNVVSDVANTLYTTLEQLHGLLPGNYILQHDSSHGINALIYATRITGGNQKLSLDFDCSQLAEADEAKSLKTAPTLTPVLLPYHKFRKILPCSFTPHLNQLAKEPKKPVTRQKTPPQAIKWPKRRLRKKPKGNTNRRQ